MRTIEIGAWMPAMGVTPGRRRPVRMMTLPPIASRRRALGLPTSSAPSGVMVAAFRPNAVAQRRGGAEHHLVPRAAAVLEREVVALELERQAGHGGVEHAQGLLQQLLAGLVALEDDYA